MASMNRPLLTWLFVLLAPALAQATLTISSIERASAVSGSGTGTITVYGGVAGDTDRCDTLAVDSVCNNCRLLTTETLPAGTPDDLLLACNNRRIHPALRLLFYVSSDAVAGTVVVTNSDGTQNLATGTTGLAKGSVGTVEVTWGALCDHLGAGSVCDFTANQVSGTIRVGISSDDDLLNNTSTTIDEPRSVTIKIHRAIGQGAGHGGTSLATDCTTNGKGVCYFEIGAGDGKAVVKAIRADTSFPVSTDINFRAIRFLYDERGFDHINLSSAYVDLPTSGTDVSTFSVSPRRVEGLQNDHTYYFKAASVDIAGNVGYYTVAANDADCQFSTNPNCHQVSPSEVVGVLSDTNCFIATAAYGANYGRELDVLRRFRENYLLPSWLGKQFVHYYNRLSPPLARAIYHSTKARAAVRAALVPIVHLTEIALEHGLIAALLAGIAATAAGIALLVLASLGVVTLLRQGRRLVPVIAPLLLTLGLLAPPQPATAESGSVSDISEAVLGPEDEAPPPPEYPYPGSTAPKRSEPLITSPAPDTTPVDTRVERKRPVRKSMPGTVSSKPLLRERPKAVSDEGDYYYDTLPVGEKQHGDADEIRFTGRHNSEKPSTISASGEFQYPVEESPFVGAAGFRFGMMAPPSVRNRDNGLTFAQIYGAEDVPALIFEYEYPFTRAIGRIGLKFETGFIFKQGLGRFRRADRIADLPEERFTFMMVPALIALHYRFQFADTQAIVPFVEGGGGYNGIAELRDDNKPPRVGGSPVLIASGGVNLLLDWVDRRSVIKLDNEYGINHIWFTAQYRQIVGLKQDLDLSSRLISGGITVDF